ncbi:MAG: DNA replication and repair protein RecF [Gemmatimonadota bacterium]|nr:MAG: DNA replication and repair protein RecF [Gemmatimonadota bacterium]
MHLTQLTARNFRNLASLDVELPTEGVVILGENGHGKTNLLEAIYYLVLFRSLRGAKDRELVRFGEAGFFLAGVAEQRITVGYETAGRRKKVTVDRGEVKKLSDGVGLVTAVAFAPADRAIVAAGPAGRRRYLDVLLSLGEPGYLAHLSAMRNALRQRNAALKRGRADEARAFDAPFARAAAHVGSLRRRWTAAQAERYAELCRALGEEAPPAMRYHPHHQREGDSPEELERGLAVTINRDLRRGMTTTGPHRDDLDLSINGKELRTYGSAGQQRTAAVALRLLEAETLTAARSSPPVALYDDVFAELDASRQARLLALIRERLPGQAIVTAPRESEVPAALLERPRWRMEGGRLAT